jgi:hypothetical protein
MVADTNSEIAWHRAQLKRHRETLKALEISRFTVGEMVGSKKVGQTEKTVVELKRKIAESERRIAEYERRTRRPLTTDLQSLASVSWGSWNARSSGQR